MSKQVEIKQNKQTNTGRTHFKKGHKLGVRFEKGQTPWNKNKGGYNLNMKVSKKGKHYSPETEFKKGKRPSNWKGGVSGRYLEEKMVKIAGRERPTICELCGDTGRICFDHCHKTEKFRGWICLRCNMALGYARDNKEILLKMIDYLKNNE